MPVFPVKLVKEQQDNAGVFDDSVLDVYLGVTGPPAAAAGDATSRGERACEIQTEPLAPLCETNVHAVLVARHVVDAVKFSQHQRKVQYAQ